MTWTKPAGKLSVTLNGPSYKSIFTNNQAEFECVITAQDAVLETNVTWTIDEKTVAGTCKQAESDRKMKVCTLDARRPDWKLHSKVKCSVSGHDSEELPVHRGGETKAKATVHILPEVYIDSKSGVTLACLVSGTMKQDYYIAWSEDEGQETGNYKEGTELLQENDKGGYMVASVYKTTKENWENKKFNCHVWPFGNNEVMSAVTVSKSMYNSVECRK